MSDDEPGQRAQAGLQRARGPRQLPHHRGLQQRALLLQRLGLGAEQRPHLLSQVVQQDLQQGWWHIVLCCVVLGVGLNVSVGRGGG